MHSIKSPKKLIEVALPLDLINQAASAEKSIRKGHPSTLHMWWARRPLVAARAIIFSQMVNDPGGVRGWSKGKPKKICEEKRNEIFGVLEELCQWKNNNNFDVLAKARSLIVESWRETCELNGLKFDEKDLNLTLWDPFSGGGAIPLEASRLGLDVYASDLNPIPVMLGKASLEIPAEFSKFSPVSLPKGQVAIENLHGYEGLAQDIIFYGGLLLDKAREALCDIYPKYYNEKDSVSEDVICWIWARTVKSPNPAFSDCDVPLIKSFTLSTKGDGAYLKPIVDSEKRSWYFEIVNKFEKPDQQGIVGRKGATCLMSGVNIPLKYIREEGRSGRIGHKLIAIVTKKKKGRGYYPADKEHEEIAKCVEVSDYPEAEIDHWAGCTNSVVYGMDRFEKLFTNRQLKTLTYMCDELKNIKPIIIDDFNSAHPELKHEAQNYANAICLYIAFSISKTANRANSLSAWMPSVECPGHLFSKHAIPMNWDYSETNILYGPSGSFLSMLTTTADGLKNCDTRSVSISKAFFADAASCSEIKNVVISTDPPYYDNIPYSNLSDFFYIWLRRSLKEISPNLVPTMLTPKQEELVANQFRHGGKEQSESFFMNGMKNTFRNLASASSEFYPMTIYYAFKQSETKSGSTASKGWETFIESIVESGLIITGTWPLRTERENRSRNQGANALASSIVLVCRKRETTAESVSRRDFQRQLRTEMPEALETMIGGQTGQTPIAPVDLAQAAIGPGMAIYSKYEAVLNQDGSKMSVHDALVLINRAITEFLSPDSGNFDADTQFCASWFDQYAWSAGPFGEAQVLAQAKGTTADGVREAGVIESGSGKVRLLKWGEYQSEWDPTTDKRTPVWEACHQMIRRLQNHGESAAGELLAKMPEKGEAIRQLSYHLYTLCERKKWAEEARAYNELIGSWHAIVAASHETGHAGEQGGLDI
ncbi:DUF1156 domain-containing protein [Vreelandella aquamarina]|uniref:DUF1156 domain-containing protein n=1 Tax=Vreelandella aquamarina TaxID=77097 RepID=A0A857GQ81_9GAMM|nr:DUF1156 domain-containing protein [Halomonas meridiana]QHD50684.1 hypothetical protein CTT34_13825 [Halomonas meridiana]